MANLEHEEEALDKVKEDGGTKSHAQKAKELFMQGYNCTQAVVGAFHEEMNLDMEQIMKMVSSLGGGMGRLREVCGAVSGMFLVIGYFYGYADPKDFQAKSEHYARIQELAAAFREENGSIVCKELLGSKGKDDSSVPDKRTKEYYKKRPCPELVERAAELVEEYMQQNPIPQS